MITESEDTTVTGENKSSKSWLSLLIFAGIAALLYIMYDKETNSFQINKIISIVDGNSKEKEKIKNQIEKTYFGLLNGAYTSEEIQGLGADGLPFYNQNFRTLLAMGFMPLALLGGDFKLEPKNIEIENITSDSASVSYDLVFGSSADQTTTPITMTVKKIGGKWKLDGNKFLPKEKEKITEEQ